MSLMSNIWPLTQVFSRMTLVRLWRNVPVKNRRAVRRRRWLNEILFLSSSFVNVLIEIRRFILFFYSAKLTKLLDLIWNLLKLKISSLVRKIFNCFFFPNISAVSEGERAARVITQPTPTIFPEFHSFFLFPQVRCRYSGRGRGWQSSQIGGRSLLLQPESGNCQNIFFPHNKMSQRWSVGVARFPSFFFSFFCCLEKKKKTPSLN